MYEFKLKHHFDAAHKLNDYDGKCANLHGHRWEVEVFISATGLANDMVVDFGFVKKMIDELDHKCINEEVDFNPTAENLASYLQAKIETEALKQNKHIIGVDVLIYESPEASIRCY